VAALSNEDLAKLVELLSKMDELGTESARRDAVTAAGLHDLLPRLDLAGSPVVATNRLVSDLDPLSLKQLIVWAKTQTGVEQQQVLDGIAQRIQSPKPPADGTPEPHGDAPKPTVVKLELDVKGGIGNFSPEAFKRELTRLLGAQVDNVRITSIQPGSVLITLEGDPQALATLADRLQHPDAAARQFARATHLVTMTYTAGGREHVVRVGAGLSTGAIVAIVIGAAVAIALATWALWPASPAPVPPGDARQHVPADGPVDGPTVPQDVVHVVPPDVAPDEITVHVQSIPPGAEIRLDGVVLGTTPVTKKLPRGTNRRAELRATKQGYAAAVQAVDATRDIDAQIDLRRLRGTATPVKVGAVSVVFRLDGDPTAAVAAANDFMAKKCKQGTELSRSGTEVVFRCGGPFGDADLVGPWVDPKTNRVGLTFEERGQVLIPDPIEPSSCRGLYKLTPGDANHATVTIAAPRCPRPNSLKLPIQWGPDDRWHAGTLVK
jgi:effector-associated domain 8 (EAD8)-containing protein/PEGA domain-containing protein